MRSSRETRSVRKAVVTNLRLSKIEERLMNFSKRDEMVRDDYESYSSKIAYRFAVAVSLFLSICASLIIFKLVLYTKAERF